MSGGNIEFNCSCGQRLRVPSSGAGQEFECPQCEKVVVCPAASQSLATPAKGGAAQSGQMPAPSGDAAEAARQQAQMYSFWNRLTTDTPETYWLWIGLCVGLGVLVPLGILLSITVIGACLGIPMAAVGGGVGGFSGVLLFYRYVRKKSEAAPG